MISPERRAVLTAKAEAYAQHVEQAVEYLRERGIGLDVARRYKLGVVPAGHEFAGRLSIPYLTVNGVVHIKYRDLTGNAKPKYLYEAGNLGARLYNASTLLHASDQAVITEGEVDAMTVEAYTGLPAVGYPGVDTWAKHPHWRMCFEGIPEVVVIGDGDEPGQKAAHRVAESIGMAARPVLMPDGHDANSYICEFGPESFVEFING